MDAPRLPSSTLAPGIGVVHRGASFVIVAKPSGMLSVPGKGEAKQDCAVARVRALLPEAHGPMVVHRLDMDTSGLLVIALTPAAQRALSRQFEMRRVEKAYVALLAGQVRDEHGVVDLPIRADIDNRPRQIVDFIHGKPSQTRYRVVERREGVTRVLFEPITGRSHQLRVHAAHGLACPILGDALYGEAASAGRLMLHASELALDDPDTGQRLRVVSEADF